ncbi:Putative S-layer protein [Nitrosotalea devaniterrae]|uniref:S-layer protein n=1 Tax=Nitrosotalea devaniterrae TaxID=1078905 RepID=A0A128A0P9_9ARCH|nr:Putative S-layer protein [Candidatus Nitrosotalea devanaterra]
MYNNTLRKITSLTLLTILLSSSAVFAMPNALPSAHASTNANLFVSAENSQWNNYFAGPQVIQVIVADPDINRLDQGYGEPTVTVNGKKLRMAQNTDGNWYGYFADSKQAQTADSTVQNTVAGKGLDFGSFCSATSAKIATGVDFSETKGVAIADQVYSSTTLSTGNALGSNGTQTPGATVSTDCGAGGVLTVADPAKEAQTKYNHVIRENKTLTQAKTGVTYGQIGFINSNAWPVVQLYDFASLPSVVTVDYHKAGGDQVVNLTFDRIPDGLLSTTVDRSAYPQNTQVFLQVNDPQLNIDPTEEDSWTWATNSSNPGVFYQLFNRNGGVDADGTTGAQNLIGNLTSLMFNHNGKLTVTPQAQSQRVIDFQKNGKDTLTSVSQRGSPATLTTASLGANTLPLTLIESGGVNVGTFGSWDGAKTSEIITVDNANIRGQSAVVRYNDRDLSLVGGFSFASIAQSPLNGTWAGGQRIPVTVTDADSNKNGRITEHLNFYDPNYKRISTMKIGTPFTLSQAGAAKITAFLTGSYLNLVHTTTQGVYTYEGLSHAASGNASMAASANLAEDEGFSARPILKLTNSTAGNVGIPNGGTLFIDLNVTAGKLQSIINNPVGAASSTKFKGFDFLNYDLRSFGSLNNVTGSSISNATIYLVEQTAANHQILDPAQNKLIKTGSFKLYSLANVTSLQGFVNLNGTQTTIGGSASNDAKVTLNNIFNTVVSTHNIGIAIQFRTVGNLASGVVTINPAGEPVAVDFFSIGTIGDGLTNDQRVNNAIYRFELEESGDNTGVFTGTNQYVMLNQLNIYNPTTYSTLRPIQHDVKFAAITDMLQAEARAPQVTYFDLGQDGVNTQISAQTDIPTHTGVVSFDSKTYKIGDTVTITLSDADLNVDNDLVDIYTAVTPVYSAATTTGNADDQRQDPATDTIGTAGLGSYLNGQTAIGRLLDVQFGQQNVRWSNSKINGTTTNTAHCFTAESNGATANGFASSLSASGFSLVETGPSTGIFTGTFEVPDQLCQSGSKKSVVGQNIKVNYVDFRDDSGKLVEVSDNSGVRGNTGSVKLDKAVYPVPYGTIGSTTSTANFDKPSGTSTTSLNGVFPLHRDLTGVNGISSTNVLTAGTVLVHIRVNDQDFNTSPIGTDNLATGVNDGNHGPVAVQITRQGSSVLLATAGGPTALGGKILTLNSTTSLPATNAAAWSQVRELGPMTEIAPDAGIFQANLPIELTDGPAGTDCPTPDHYDASINGSSTFGAQSVRFYTTSSTPYCVRQGDVLTVTYIDNNDASGNTQTVTDSSTFDLRNGVLQSDKSVYIIGSDMILTLVEPDFNLDSQTAETVPLDLVEWDSHAFKKTMGPLGGESAAFDAKPSTFVETGKDTGIFQSVIKVPKTLNGNLLERGEQIHLEYTDWGPAGSKTVGKNNQDIQLTIYTSNFGATVELDQKVYTWTDRVYITVVAPDHNFDPNLIDIIGDNDENKVTVSTRGNSLSPYKLVETGVDTGIFTGYVILQGDSSIVSTGGVDGAGLKPVGVQGVTTGSGPTNGFLPATEQDGVSVSFEFTRDQTVTGSALIRWNIGEIKWLEASYPANGQGVLQIVDPDMNLNPKAVDKFDTNVWSDSDSGGIKLTMTETGEATGIFQGTIYFTTNFQSSGNRLHVAEGDTVTGEYRDRTLPPPYTPSDQLRLTSTTFIGTVVPPLERAPASNPRIVDSFGNAVTGAVKSGQQIQITADLTNGQDRDQPFAYLVQIQDANGVTVSLSWITGTLTAGQSLNPAQSWTPQSSGTYTAQIFVWQSIDNPNALSPPLSTTINVA